MELENNNINERFNNYYRDILLIHSNIDIINNDILQFKRNFYKIFIIIFIIVILFIILIINDILIIYFH